MIQINSPLPLIIICFVCIALILYFYLIKNRLSHTKILIVTIVGFFDVLALILLCISVLNISIVTQQQAKYILVDASYSMTLQDYPPNRFERIKNGILESQISNEASIIPYGGFPLEMSVEQFQDINLKQFQDIRGWSGSAPGDALAWVVQKQPTNIILITDGGINSGLDLVGIEQIYTGKLIIGLLQSNDSFVELSGTKTQLIQMNKTYRQSVTRGKNKLYIISKKDDFQQIFSSAISLERESISGLFRTIGRYILLVGLMIRLLVFVRKKKVA